MKKILFGCFAGATLLRILGCSDGDANNLGDAQTDNSIGGNAGGESARGGEAGNGGASVWGSGGAGGSQNAGGSSPSAGSGGASAGSGGTTQECLKGTWKKVSKAPIEENRVNVVSSSNGQTVFVGGGVQKYLGGGDISFPDSAIYNPADDSWASLGYFEYSDSYGGNYASPYFEQYARWGQNFWVTKGSSWESLKTNVVEHSTQGGMFWTGSSILAWGNLEGAFVGYRISENALSWTKLSQKNQPPPLTGASSAVSAQGALFIWGGKMSDGSISPQGYLYDEKTDAWKEVSLQNAPKSTYFSRVVWAKDRFFVWGGGTDPGSAGASYLQAGAEYFPDSDEWVSVPTVNAPTVIASSAFWTGKYVLVWGDQGTRKLYSMEEKVWYDISSCGAPKSIQSVTQWTAAGLFVWGGAPESTGSLLTLD